MERRRKKQGLTLVELLVGMTVATVILGAVAFLFIASSRAVQQGFTSMRGFEQARGAFGQLERDLTTAFTARDFGDVYSLYGTPIGMMFVGVAGNRVGSALPGELGISRVTYVIYVPSEPTAFTDLSNENVQTYMLLRYAEPGVSDLDTFPVNWSLLATASDPEVPGIAVKADNLLEELLTACECDFLDYEDDPIGNPLDPISDQRLTAKKRELWIRMLANDPTLPDLWSYLEVQCEEKLARNINELQLDYVLADGIMANTIPDPFPWATNFWYTGSYVRMECTSLDYPDPGRPFEIIVRENQKIASSQPFLPWINLYTNQLGGSGDVFLCDNDDRDLANAVAEAAFFAYGQVRKDPRDIKMTSYWNNTTALLAFQPEVDITNGLDDDGDGLIDEGPEMGHDGIDNDGDGLIDEQDEDVALGSSLTPRLPALVRFRCRIRLEGRYFGSPGFDHEFEQIIDLPTGYMRRSVDEVI